MSLPENTCPRPTASQYQTLVHLTRALMVRRRLVTHSSMSLSTCVRSESYQEWETGPCDVPLFSDEERAAGQCLACAEGWTHPHNYPVDQGPPDASAVITQRWEGK